VKIKQIKQLLYITGLVFVAMLLNACSSEPSPWTKSSSPWDQRRGGEVEAPAADIYKADLEMPMEGGDQVELSYQAEPVDSFAPDVVADEPVEEVTMVAEEPAMTESSSIMDFPASHYTVQLMASIDIDRVYRFAEQNQISTQYVIPTERDGVTWHVLLLGVYPDYSSAVASKDEVASSLSTQPWIRKVGAVQNLMQ